MNPTELAAEAAETILRNLDRATYKKDWLSGVIQTAIEKATVRIQQMQQNIDKVKELEGEILEMKTARQLVSRAARASEALELLELAWGIIANASGGDWEKESKEWVDAAVRWRDRYFNSATSAPLRGEQPNAHRPPNEPAHASEPMAPDSQVCPKCGNVGCLTHPHVSEQGAWTVDKENKELIAPTGERFSVGFASMDSRRLADLINREQRADTKP